MRDRFSVVEDPSGLFFIWDEPNFEPIMDGENILVFMTVKEANRAALKLNGAANDDRPARERARAAYRLQGQTLTGRAGEVQSRSNSNSGGAGQHFLHLVFST